MGERQALIEELERQDLIAELTAMDDPAPEGPSGMEMTQQFARGAVPFANEVRGAVDATAMKVFGDDEASWSELQDTYSQDQVADESKIREQAPGLANTLEAAGGMTSLMTGGGALANLGGKSGAKVMAREAAEAAAKKAKRSAAKPHYFTKPAGAKATPPAIPAPVTGSGGLKSATEALKGLGKATAATTAATAVGGPVGGTVAAGISLLRSPMGKKLAQKLARKIGGDDMGEVAKHGLHAANRKWIRDVFGKGAD